MLTWKDIEEPIEALETYLTEKEDIGLIRWSKVDIYYSEEKLMASVSTTYRLWQEVLIPGIKRMGFVVLTNDGKDGVYYLTVTPPPTGKSK